MYVFGVSQSLSGFFSVLFKPILVSFDAILLASGLPGASRIPHGHSNCLQGGQGQFFMNFRSPRGVAWAHLVTVVAPHVGSWTALGMLLVSLGSKF